jgi:hypothetical protein
MVGRVRSKRVVTRAGALLAHQVVGDPVKRSFVASEGIHPSSEYEWV